MTKVRLMRGFKCELQGIELQSDRQGEMILEIIASDGLQRR